MLRNDIGFLAGRAGLSWRWAHDVESQAIEAIKADGWEAGIAILEAALRELRAAGRRA